MQVVWKSDVQGRPSAGVSNSIASNGMCPLIGFPSAVKVLRSSHKYATKGSMQFPQMPQQKKVFRTKQNDVQNKSDRVLEQNPHHTSSHAPP